MLGKGYELVKIPDYLLYILTFPDFKVVKVWMSRSRGLSISKLRSKHLFFFNFVEFQNLILKCSRESSIDLPFPILSTICLRFGVEKSLNRIQIFQRHPDSSMWSNFVEPNVGNHCCTLLLLRRRKTDDTKSFQFDWIIPIGEADHSFQVGG